MILVTDAHQPTKDENLVSTAGSCMANAGWGCRTPSNDGCHPLHTVSVQDSHILYQLIAPLSAACIPNMCIALSQQRVLVLIHGLSPPRPNGHCMHARLRHNACIICKSSSALVTSAQTMLDGLWPGMASRRQQHFAAGATAHAL